MALDPVRFGIIGLGAFGETYLACLAGLRDSAGVEVTAVCSHSAERAQAVAARYGVPRWYTDASDLASDPTVDVAVVVTYEAEHLRPTVACLEAGKDVIVEKPMTTNLAEADEMISSARSTGRKLMVGHVLRFCSPYCLVAERIAAGELGKVVSMRSRQNRPAQATARYRRTHPLLELAVHDVDSMIWLSASPVARVRCFQRTVNPGPSPDLVVGILEFQSGALGLVETNLVAADQGGLFSDDELTVVGDRGTARIDATRAPLAVWSADGYTVPDVLYEPRVDGGVIGAVRDELLYFVGCVRANRQPDRVPLADARHGLEVLLAMIRSAEEGRDVSL